MATDPQFTVTPNVGQAALTAANPNRDGTGALVLGFTAGANGGRIDKIVVKATVSTTAGMVRAFLKNGAGVAMLVTEVPIDLVTVSATVPGFEVVTDLLGGLPVPAGWTLQLSTHNAEAINVTTFGGDF